MGEAKSFWTTLPGILTGMAGLITAIGGLLVILDQIEVFHPNNDKRITDQTMPGPDWRGKVEPEPHPTGNRVKELEKQLADIEIKIKNLEEQFSHSPQTQGVLYELQETSKERGKRLAEIEKLQTASKIEVERLRLQATDADARRKIEQIEGETIPDLEAERIAVHRHIRELKDMIHNAENNDQLKREIADLRKQKQSWQEEFEYLTKRMQ
ncbi:MAG: hypothetical protein KJ804_08970 [Proteobacteria bacterium]|nr:hypothetical protein [Pseudomonadota bacterium]MBU1058430.1 hypothetical protein [Pseudomonadota bacterium]